jgi:hypothetical protein
MFVPGFDVDHDTVRAVPAVLWATKAFDFPQNIGKGFSLVTFTAAVIEDVNFLCFAFRLMPYDPAIQGTFNLDHL